MSKKTINTVCASSLEFNNDQGLICGSLLCQAVRCAVKKDFDCFFVIKKSLYKDFFFMFKLINFKLIRHAQIQVCAMIALV